MDERAERMERALILARGECTVPDCEYINYCPLYWERVFVLYFGDKPADDKDPRWDKLFRAGFPAKKILLEKERDVKTAS